MQQAVRCPNCEDWSRVPESALGQHVICPNCQRPFAAWPEDPDDFEDEPFDPPRRETGPEELAPRIIPIVYPAKRREIPIVRPVSDASDELLNRLEDEPSEGPKSVLFGLALLPFVIPLLWLLGPTLTGKAAFFTIALPIFIAISSTGMCMGVVLAADWSFATRVRSILAIVFLMHFAAAFLYFLKTEWVEAVRKRLGRNKDEVWQVFRPPGERYSVRVPSEMRPDDKPLIEGWDLNGFRTFDKNDPATYFVARGRQPADLNFQPDDKFFEEVRQKAAAAAGGTFTSEKEVRLPNYPGREYVFTLPDRTSKRIVRVYRLERIAFVAAVEGAFLTPDANDVKSFFAYIDLSPKR